ncbi:MAG: transcription antitermination factor NusB [Patescibacteria group bacterium]
MASNRHFARIILMQSLYEFLQRGGDLPTIVKRNIANHDFDENNTKFILKIAEGAQKNITEIDEVISISAPEWPLPQIAQVDLSILRLAIFELLFDDEVPPKAVINEAVELSKAFGGENTSKFVNGVLGTVYRNSAKYQEEEAKAAARTSKPPTPPDNN